MAEPEPPTSSGSVDAQEHARVLKNYVDLSDQFAAANEVLSAVGRSAGDPDAVLTTVVESARRLCRSQSCPPLPAGGRRLPPDQGGGADRGVDPVHRRAPDAVDRETLSAGRTRPDGPADRRRAEPTRSTGVRTSSGSRGTARHGCPDAPRRRGHRGLNVWRNEVSPFDEREMAIVTGVRGPGRDGGQRRQARPGARGARRRAGEEGRPARGAAARSARRSAPAWTSTTCSSTIAMHAVELSGTDGGSIMEYAERDRCFLVRSVYRTEPERGRAARGDPDRPRRDARSGGRRASDGRSRSPDLGAVDLDPHLQILYDAGWRSLVAVPMLREDQIVGSPGRAPQADRRLLRGDPRPPGDVRGPVRPGDAQRPALPRAPGAERRAGGGQPAQVGVPGEHVPRAADPAQRRARVLGGAAGADVRRDQRAPGGVPPRHPRLGQAPAGAAQRDPRPVQGRGRPDGAGVLGVRAARRCSSTPRRCCASAPPRTASTSRVEVADDVEPCTPTSCGSSRSCSTC